MEKLHFETLAIHASMEPDPSTGAIAPPLYTSTIFEHPESGLDASRYNYTRADNPNRASLEELIARLENGETAAAFSSGVAAVHAIFQALKPGDHVLAPVDVYHGTRKLLNELMSDWGLTASYADMTNPKEVELAIRPETRLIWIETPSNPLLQITDIEVISALAHKNNIVVCVDNTWLTPVLQRPLDLGADIVMHSTTKYLGGHSDILGGAVISKNKDEFFRRIKSVQTMAGAVPSPFDCWLLGRSIRTLPYRMRAHNDNAMKIARFLESQPNVERVCYPGLESDPGHAIAKKQASGYGGMLSFFVKGDAERALKVVSRSRLIRRATSLGGVESTWEHRQSSEGQGSPTASNLIRLSVGLEHPDDLIFDIKQALAD